jgi:tetratricopeptide (TPR) repeat protein
MAHYSGEDALLLAQGLAAVRSGDLAGADRAATALRVGASKDPEQAAMWSLQEKEVQALALQARGKTEEALTLLREAVELEERMPPPSGPPVPLKPAHELYGEVLLEAGRAEEASRQFEASLLRTPNRAASLLGAARSAVRMGDREAARRRYAALAEVWRQADADLPALAEIRAYLKDAPAR